ncbi:hypothetical protein [Thermoactinomyces mirandus]|uniref:Uncharacterized protein n=1 Tax=Thermoactinomyces mirandus TaxID=2756294 RepID=A0A7W2AS82_9BACL|nr:hypothetical protein [Thermoactinomyces mirandus]MBA4603338.1 hypothetical protein [Thermoactinomyces mirandus]
MIRLTEEEEKLLKDSCDKNKVQTEHMKELMEVEHNYSLQEKARRDGLKGLLKEKIENWTGDQQS